MAFLPLIPWFIAVASTGVAGGAVVTHAAGEAAEDSSKPGGAIWTAIIIGLIVVLMWAWSKYGNNS